MASTELSTTIVSGEVLPPAASLDQLLSQANNEHHRVEEALGGALESAIKSGEALNEIRDRFYNRGWEAWVRENFEGTPIVASYYMRIAEYRDLVGELPNITQAMKRLQGMPALRPPGYRGYSEEIREEARTLAGKGISRNEIARILGVSSSTVTNWLDPEALKRHRKKVREQSRQRREEARRKKEEATRRAIEREAKRAGGALAEVYSMAHKIEAPLALAAREATDPEVKAELDKAVGFQHQMMYNIIRALGAS